MVVLDISFHLRKGGVAFFKELVLPLTEYYRSTVHTAVVRFLAPTPGELQDSIFITPLKAEKIFWSCRAL